MTTTARRKSSTSSSSLVQRIVGGIIGGVAGGLVFGAMMGLMDMLPTVAGVVGSNSPIVGFVYHMFNSVIIGAVFGLVFGARSHTYSQGAVLGLLYGAIWWVLGPMILMPLMMGMGTVGISSQVGAALSAPMLMSLAGHLVYGLLTGLVYVGYVGPRPAASDVEAERV